MSAAADPAALAAVEWEVATRPLAGETESGDLHLVVPFSGGVLAGAIDGLGHGREAARAARAAADALRRLAGASLPTLVRGCHEALHGTRGVVLSLASIQIAQDSVSWLGIGNVEAMLFRGDRGASSQREAVLHVGGVVGYELPPIAARTVRITPGDTLIFATDGIDSAFFANLLTDRSLGEICSAALLHHARANDDALILALRYRGGER